MAGVAAPFSITSASWDKVVVNPRVAAAPVAVSSMSFADLGNSDVGSFIAFFTESGSGSLSASAEALVVRDFTVPIILPILPSVVFFPASSSARRFFFCSSVSLGSTIPGGGLIPAAASTFRAPDLRRKLRPYAAPPAPTKPKATAPRITPRSDDEAAAAAAATVVLRGDGVAVKLAFAKSKGVIVAVKLIILTGEWENVCVPLVETETETEPEPDAVNATVCDRLLDVLSVMESERDTDSVVDSVSEFDIL